VRALITGITGQAGSYLAEQLAAEGHQVFGLLHGQRNPKRAWIESLVPEITLIEGDLLDQSSLQRSLVTAEPDVVFNLGALTYVGMSWQQPTLMTEVTGLGCLRMLEAIRAVNPDTRFVQASTSEMFGNSPAPQSESTPFHPRSPYGVAKLFAHHTTVNYRDSYGMHASTAVMFNAESPRRGEEFVTRKVTAAVARIARGEQANLRLGNLAARRDWGWIPDFMRAWALIAEQEQPDDYVLATGESHSVAELCEVAFAEAGLDWRDHVQVDPDLFRPADVEHLCGDPAKAGRVLGWEPSVFFTEIVKRMVAAETLEVAA
jgi:GDPmannose 4,6-dehydratase